MSREILFRGRTIEGNWIEGDLLNHYIHHSTGKTIVNSGGCVYHEVIPETVGQFTGLLDKKGNKIFEGDIIVQQRYPYFDNGVPNYVSEVSWIYSAWEHVLHCINPLKSGISDGINERIDEGEDDENTSWEIIGNIHDNQELIGKEVHNG